MILQLWSISNGYPKAYSGPQTLNVTSNKNIGYKAGYTVPYIWLWRTPWFPSKVLLIIHSRGRLTNSQVAVINLTQKTCSNRWLYVIICNPKYQGAQRQSTRCLVGACLEIQVQSTEHEVVDIKTAKTINYWWSAICEAYAENEINPSEARDEEGTPQLDWTQIEHTLLIV